LTTDDGQKCWWLHYLRYCCVLNMF